MDTGGNAGQGAFTPPRIQPAERPRSTLGLLWAMLRDPVAAVPQAAYEEPCVRTSAAGQEVIFLSDPALVEAVLVREHENFAKSRIDLRVLEPMLGRSLLTAEGQTWRWQRRLAAPAFRMGTLSSYLPAMRAPFEALALRWASAPGPHRIDDAMTATTIDVICRAFFSDFTPSDADRVSDAINRYLAPVTWTIAYGTLGLPAFTPHPGKLRMRRATGEARSIVRTFVARRRQRRPEVPDLAQVLMEAQDPETGRSLSDDDLVDLFLTLIVAGHETSANALTWTLYCLAAQPERQDALATRIREVIGEGAVEAQHLDALGEVKQFLEEAMRLFPPVPMLFRRPLRDCQAGAVHIRTGSLIFIPVYAIHRHRALWSDPEVFDTDRFRPAAERTRPRCAYMPFGAGPRICIGASFATMEMIVGLASLLAKVRVLPRGEFPPQPIHRVTLRAEREVVLAVERRD